MHLHWESDKGIRSGSPALREHSENARGRSTPPTRKKKENTDSDSKGLIVYDSDQHSHLALKQATLSIATENQAQKTGWGIRAGSEKQFFAPSGRNGSFKARSGSSQPKET